MNKELTAKDLADNISLIINQDGDDKTDGQVIDEIATYLNGLGLYTERPAFEPTNAMPTFFWKDKSVRGETGNVTLQYLVEPVDYGLASYDGDMLHEWAQCAEIGDTWENSTDEYTRIS